MAKLSPFTSLLAVLLLITTASAIAITDIELDRTIFALRASGYNLFSNAIATSDLRYQILSAAAYNSFTIFSPVDTALFALDMSSPAAAYIQTLHYHVSPRRLTANDLRNLTYLDTLLPHFRLLLDTDPLNVTVFVDGVRISRPNLFIGSGIAVHGLDGILVPGELGDSLSPQISPPAAKTPLIQANLNVSAISTPSPVVSAGHTPSPSEVLPSAAQVYPPSKSPPPAQTRINNRRKRGEQIGRAHVRRRNTIRHDNQGVIPKRNNHVPDL